MTEWDYQMIKVDKYNNEDLLAKLKNAGQDGWELIQIISYPTGSLDLAIMKKHIEKRRFWIKNDKKLREGLRDLKYISILSKS